MKAFDVLRVKGITVFVFLLLIEASVCVGFIQGEKEDFSTFFIVVSARGERFVESFSSIQQAINEAESGSTIYVPAGIYFENVIVNKSVSLFGEQNFSSVIDGAHSATVVEVTADNVTISSFKLQNSGYGWNRHGVYVDSADNCTIRNNLLQNCCHTVKLNYSRNSQVIDNRINGTMTSPTMYGIRIENSTNCTVIGNDVTDCVGAIHLQNATYCVVRNNKIHGNSQGVRFYSPCAYNNVSENLVYNSNYDGMISTMPGNATFCCNRIFHNSFVNNTNSFIFSGNTSSGFTWDDGYPSGGNHWSRYNGTDAFKGVYQNETGYDGIGDTHYHVSDYDEDRYPIMHPYGSIRNLNTCLTYYTIQSAIDSEETQSGHTIFVKNGTYNEHLNINKTVAIIGEDSSSTIIDGENTGTCVAITIDNVTFAGFTVRKSGLLFPPYGNDCGIVLDRCGGANISHNIVSNNRIGIYLYYSIGTIVEGNVVHSNREDGMLLWHSGNNVLTRNLMVNNTRNFGVFGDTYLNFDNVVDQSNIVDGKPIYYLINTNGATIENQTDVGVLYLINCTNVTVRNMEFTNNAHGVFCFNVSYSRIENITSLRNSYGVNLQLSMENLLHGNHCIDNWVGVVLQDSNENSVEGNIVVGGEKGVSLYGANNNTIKENTIMNTTFGLRLHASMFNTIFHNNFVENTEQASILQGSYQNRWDNGIEGNYWSDYRARDDDMNGLGDESYTLDSQNQDNYPLQGCFHAFIALRNGSLHQVDVTSNSTVLSFAFDEFFNVIKINVNGSDSTLGFCRIRVPHALVEPELNVIIDDGLTQVLNANYSLFDDGFARWIFFAYLHSTHEILVVQEFQFLPIFWLVSISQLLLVFYKKRR